MDAEDGDEIHFHFSEYRNADCNCPVLVYLITGNPGLAAYYTVFLSDLFQRIRNSDHWVKRRSLHVYASNLPGFEVDRAAPRSPHRPPYNLRETTALVHERLDCIAADLKRDYDLPPNQNVATILMGHSIGSYIMLEIIASQQKSRYLDIKAGICLFPTIIDIAKSPMGVKLGPLVTHIPFFPQIVQLIAKAAFGLLPLSFVARIVSAVNGMPDDAAMTTAKFLTSPGGVKQALYLARHELAEVRHDKWDDKVWGAAAAAAATSSSTSASQRPKLFFYWGEADHWIANETRDAVIASRGRQTAAASTSLDDGNGGVGLLARADDGDSWKPKMEIDTLGVPHDFCIRHSRPIAAKVSEYIEEVMASM